MANFWEGTWIIISFITYGYMLLLVAKIMQSSAYDIIWIPVVVGVAECFKGTCLSRSGDITPSCGTLRLKFQTLILKNSGESTPRGWQLKKICPENMSQI